MARAAVAAGTTTMVATPHLDGHWGVRLDEIADRVTEVRAALAQARIPLLVEAGAEVAYERLPELEDDAAYARAALGNGPYLLVECPLSSTVPMTFDAAVLELLRAGRKVLLAHPERSPALQRDPQRLGRLVDAGALTSITASALAGRFGGTVHRAALGLISEGLVHSLASDTHDPTRRAPALTDGLPGVRPGAPRPPHVVWWTRDVPAAILAGRAIPEAPAPLRRR